jgi:hypothetical protein
MKKNITAYSILIIIITAMSCQKEPKTALTYYGDYLSDYARIKIVNGSPSLKAFHVWVNGIKINGATANAPLSYGSLWPLQDYSDVAAGTGTVSVVYPATAARPDSVYKAVAYAMQPGKYYSMIVTDSVARPNKAVFVTDDFGSMADSGYYKFRFVNAIANSTPLDLYSVRQQKVVASNIAYAGASAFVKLPISFIYTATSTTTTDTFYMRRNGTTVNITQPLFTLTPSNQRSITIYARGSFLDSSAAGTTRRILATYTNY